MVPDGSPTTGVPTVLLVEGTRDERHMYAEYLRLHAFHVVEVGNTADALALAPTADVVVTAISLPGPFDGIELVRRLRVDDQTKHEAIIVVTACTYEPDQRRAWAAGADGFLPKPCLPETLEEEIRRTLTARPPRGHRVAASPTRRDVA